MDKGCPFEGCAPYDLVITGTLGFVHWWDGWDGGLCGYGYGPGWLGEWFMVGLYGGRMQV